MKARKKAAYKYRKADWDEQKTVEVLPEKNMPGISTSIRLSAEMIRKLRKVARRKGGIGYQTLLKMWIAERLEQEGA